MRFRLALLLGLSLVAAGCGGNTGTPAMPQQQGVATMPNSTVRTPQRVVVGTPTPGVVIDTPVASITCRTDHDDRNATAFNPEDTDRCKPRVTVVATLALNNGVFTVNTTEKDNDNGRHDRDDCNDQRRAKATPFSPSATVNVQLQDVSLVDQCARRHDFDIDDNDGDHDDMQAAPQLYVVEFARAADGSVSGAALAGPSPEVNGSAMFTMPTGLVPFNQGTTYTFLLVRAGHKTPILPLPAPATPTAP